MALHAVRKITVREILKGKPEKENVITGKDAAGNDVVENRVKEQDIALIYGQAHSIESGSSAFGPYTTFFGRMEARRFKDGEIFQATRAIFPAIAEDIAVQHFLEAKREDATALVEMAFVVGVEYDGRGTEGYKFTVKPVSTGEQREDPLAALRAAMAPALLEILGDSTAKVLQLTNGTAVSKASSGKQKETSAS